MVHSIRLAIQFRDGRLVAATVMFLCMSALRTYELATRTGSGFVWFETFGDLIIVGLALAAPVAIISFGRALSEREHLLRETLVAQQSRRRLLHQVMSGQEEERRLLSARIHDHIAQPLVATKLLIQSLRHEPTEAESTESSSEAIDRVVGHLGEAAQVARSLWVSLSPSALKPLGLARAIRELASSFESPRLTIRLELEVPEGCFPESWDIDVYRLVQEGLINVARHSQASAVWIGARTDAENFTLYIADNGRGYDPASQVPGAGLGLAIAAERAAKLGGTLHVGPRMEGGTEMILALPLRDRRE